MPHLSHAAFLSLMGLSKKFGNTVNLLRNGTVFKALYTPLNPLLLEGTCLPPNKGGIKGGVLHNVLNLFHKLMIQRVVLMFLFDKSTDACLKLPLKGDSFSLVRCEKQRDVTQGGDDIRSFSTAIES